MTNGSPNRLPPLILVLIGIFIFIIGLRISYTNIDEAYFADPAINFLTGHGYTTTSWNITGPSETHVSTAPAYSFLLVIWLKVFGVSQYAVRALSATLVLCGACVFWRACLRAGFIKSGIAGALVIAVLILDYGYAYSYSVGRPDALSALCVAALLYFSTLQNQRCALGVMGVVAMLLPFVQWSCVIYLFFLSMALLLIAWQKTIRYVVVVGLGMAVGLLIQKAAYTHFGVWETWLHTIKTEGSESLLQRIGNRMNWTTLIYHNSNTIPKDFSALIILAGMGFLYLCGIMLRRRTGLTLAKSAWIIASVVTFGMYLVGKFPTYYGWMLSLPLAAIIGSYFDRVYWSESRSEAGLVIVIAVMACAVGLPLQAGLASHDWQDRQPGAMAAWLGPKITKDDVVFCDDPFYYVVKERAGLVFTGRRFRTMSSDEFNRLTMVVVCGHCSDWDQSKRTLTNQWVLGRWQPERNGILGNDWRYGILSAPNYDCTVYRLTKPGR